MLEERNRLAREIHDSLGQGLTGLIWQLNAAERSVEAGGEEALKSLERVRSLARESLQEARRSVWDLRAGPLKGLSLAEALQQEMRKIFYGTDVQVSFDLSGTERVLLPGMEAAALRICQESLADIVKHANATEVTLTLSYSGSTVRLNTRDNGVGFNPETPTRHDRDKGGSRLTNMGERARLLGGELTVTSELCRGTLLDATLPLK